MQDGEEATLCYPYFSQAFSKNLKSLIKFACEFIGKKTIDDLTNLSSNEVDLPIILNGLGAQIVISKIEDSLFNLNMFKHVDENTFGDFVCAKMPYDKYFEMDEKETEAFLHKHENEYNEWKYSVDYSTCPAYHLRDVYCVDQTSKEIIIDMWNEWLKTDLRKRLPAYVKLLEENL